MIFEIEKFSNERIKEIEMANMITKNWYAICDLTVIDNIKIKVMEYRIDDLIYDIYAMKNNNKIFFKGFAHDEFCEEYGCKNWEHEQLINFFLHDEEQAFVEFFTKDIESICESIKEFNKYWEDVQYGMYLFILNGKVSKYGNEKWI